MIFARQFFTNRAADADIVTAQPSAQLGRLLYLAVRHRETTVFGHMTRDEAQKLFDELRAILEGSGQTVPVPDLWEDSEDY